MKDGSIILKKLIEVSALALFCRGRVLIARRSAGNSGAGQWEFPGGKLDAGESSTQALVREIFEELHYDIKRLELKYVGDSYLEIPDKLIRISLWRSQVEEFPNFKLVDHDAIKWVNVDELPNINLSIADVEFIPLLKNN